MDEEDIVEDLGISLHALTGIDIGDTMKLQVTINGSMLVALVDSSSTHTFIREAVASQIGLRVAPRPASLSRSPMGTESQVKVSALSSWSPLTTRSSTSTATFYPSLALT
jgi:hypothetical protein